jgi:hypothetical protein
MQINPVNSALNNEPPMQKALDSSVLVTKKALEAQKDEGQAAVNLIQNAAPQVASTPEVSQPVVKNGKVDTYA